MRKGIIALAGIAILVLVNLAILDKERLLRDGRIVLLELAPVDPRSLMQGDYMALRFALANDLRAAAPAPTGVMPADGHLVVGLDSQGVGRFRRIDRGEPLAADEVKLRYRIRGHEVRIGSNAFFFQEGDAALYERARFGELRVDTSGELLLVGLRGAELQRLGGAGG